MTFQQPDLPYELGDLGKFVSKETMDFHYNKHHKAYFNNLNKLIEGKPESEKSLEAIIQTSSGPIFNNAAQAWNHVFFWNCMSPNGGGSPTGEVKKAIDRDFGGFDGFFSTFSNAAATLFGSGWAWLTTSSDGVLDIMSLANGDNPLKHSKIPLLGLDVWEHAYYIDYRNDRPGYIKNFKEVIHWDFVEKCYLNR